MSFAATELREYPARKVCQLLAVPRSSLYYAQRHGGRRAVDKKEECEAVLAAATEHHGSFGRRMLKRILAGKGICMSERKISRIMKELGIRSKYGRKKTKNINTSEATEKYFHENIFNQMSEAERAAKEIWSMDFTEVKIGKVRIFTCGIISVNRKILVGYSQGKKCDSALAIAAVKKAISQYGKPDMIMTDRGAQFTSKAFFDMIQQLGIIHSMSRPHKPVDNRFIETFWKSMKIELGNTSLLNEQTYSMVTEYYIYYYNNLRPHSSLGYVAPLAA